MAATSGAPEFADVHDRFRPRVLRYLTRLVGERDAEDLAQSVMLKISEALPSFRGDSSLSTWIYRIATNTALDALRRKAARPTAQSEVDWDEDDVPPGAQAPSVETAATREQMSACVREFIERLPENYRLVVALSELEGFTNDEIAHIVGTTVDTVKIRLHRGRERLRRDLEDGCSFNRDEDGEFGCERKPVTFVKPRQGG